MITPTKLPKTFFIEIPKSLGLTLIFTAFLLFGLACLFLSAIWLSLKIGLFVVLGRSYYSSLSSHGLNYSKRAITKLVWSYPDNWKIFSQKNGWQEMTIKSYFSSKNFLILSFKTKEPSSLLARHLKPLVVILLKQNLPTETYHIFKIIMQTRPYNLIKSNFR